MDLILSITTRQNAVDRAAGQSGKQVARIRRTGRRRAGARGSGRSSGRARAGRSVGCSGRRRRRVRAAAIQSTGDQNDGAVSHLDGRTVVRHRNGLAVLRAEFQFRFLPVIYRHCADDVTVNDRRKCRSHRKIDILDLDLDLAVAALIELPRGGSVRIDAARGRNECGVPQYDHRCRVGFDAAGKHWYRHPSRDQGDHCRKLY